MSININNGLFDNSAIYLNNNDLDLQENAAFIAEYGVFEDDSFDRLELGGPEEGLFPSLEQLLQTSEPVPTFPIEYNNLSLPFELNNPFTDTDPIEQSNISYHAMFDNNGNHFNNHHLDPTENAAFTVDYGTFDNDLLFQYPPDPMYSALFEKSLDANPRFLETPYDPNMNKKRKTTAKEIQKMSDKTVSETIRLRLTTQNVKDLLANSYPTLNDQTRHYFKTLKMYEGRCVSTGVDIEISHLRALLEKQAIAVNKCRPVREQLVKILHARGIDIPKPKSLANVKVIQNLIKNLDTNDDTANYINNVLLPFCIERKLVDIDINNLDEKVINNLKSLIDNSTENSKANLINYKKTKENITEAYNSILNRSQKNNEQQLSETCSEPAQNIAMILNSLDDLPSELLGQDFL